MFNTGVAVKFNAESALYWIGLVWHARLAEEEGTPPSPPSYMVSLSLVPIPPGEKRSGEQSQFLGLFPKSGIGTNEI